VEINGVAHIILRVSRFEECVVFYDALMPRLGLEAVFRTDDSVYYVGGRTAVGIQRPAPDSLRTLTRSWRPGSITSASALAIARTSTRSIRSCRGSGPISYERRRTGRGRRAITHSRSGIPKGFAWRSTTCPGKAC
jgi:catechol 2,3-dioxygenase-like lactoylglutathione lyase family enzyme